MSTLGVRFGFVQRSKKQTASNRSLYQRYHAVQNGNLIRTFHDPRNRTIHSAEFAPASAPNWASDMRKLWKQAGYAERRRDAVEGRTLDLSLPRGFSDRCYTEICDAIAAIFLNMNLAIQLDIHETPALDGELNPHAHFLISTRCLNAAGFALKKSTELIETFSRQRGRALRSMLASIITQHAQSEQPKFSLSSGPSAIEKPKERRLPRWQVKSSIGRENLILRRQVRDLASIRARRDEIIIKLSDLNSRIIEIEHGLNYVSDSKKAFLSIASKDFENSLVDLCEDDIPLIDNNNVEEDCPDISPDDSIGDIDHSQDADENFECEDIFDNDQDLNY